tara:strand:- start:1217 stop:1828 length:612 start_codon:yes stop_codon:yes gene_type:complete
MSVLAKEYLVSDWSSNGFLDWRIQEFKGMTRYTLTDHSGYKVVQVKSENSASVLYKNIEININKTPIINWSWMASFFNETGLEKTESERTKLGDDFVLRIYVVASAGPLPWQKNSIVYVMARGEAVGNYWSNPFTNRAIIYVADNYNLLVGSWVTHKINIKTDFKRFFNQDVDTIEGVALMTDTDNSEAEALAYYGDIYFSKD